MEKIEKPPEKIVTGEENDNNYIEPEEQEKWLNFFEKENTDMSLLFETMLLTGLRPECACGLKWKALDVENKELIINNAYKSFNIYNEDHTKIIGHERRDAPLKTPKSYRNIPINDRLIKILLQHKKEQQELFKKSRAIKDHHRKWSENEYMFIGRNYHPYVSESLDQGMRKFRKKYNLEYVTAYGLRRSFATYWSSKGMNKLVLMKLLGHSCYETTVKHYIKISSKQIKAEMERINRAS